MSMQELTKYLDDDRLFDADLTDLLDDDETILTAAVQAPGSGLVLGAPVANAAPIPYPLRARTAAPGKSLQFRIAAGTLPPGARSRHVAIRITVATTKNPSLSASVCLVLTDGTATC